MQVFLSLIIADEIAKQGGLPEILDHLKNLGFAAKSVPQIYNDIRKTGLSRFEGKTAEGVPYRYTLQAHRP